MLKSFASKWLWIGANWWETIKRGEGKIGGVQLLPKAGWGIRGLPK